MFFAGKLELRHAQIPEESPRCRAQLVKFHCAIHIFLSASAHFGLSWLAISTDAHAYACKADDIAVLPVDSESLSKNHVAKLSSSSGPNAAGSMNAVPYYYGSLGSSVLV